MSLVNDLDQEVENFKREYEKFGATSPLVHVLARYCKVSRKPAKKSVFQFKVQRRRRRKRTIFLARIDI